MANSLGIDFNPEPSAGSNPFESIQQGLGLGLGVVNQVQQIQQAKQQQMAALQQATLEKEKLAMERGQKGLDILTNPKYGNFISPEVKTQVLRESIIPFANKAYGLNIDPSQVEYKNEYDNLLKLVKNGAPADIIKREYMATVSKADKESLPVLKEIGDTLGVTERTSGITPYQQESLTRQGKLDAGRLRVEFLNRPEVKEFVTINTQVKSMDALLNKAMAGDEKNKVALDQALISMFNKLTDPSSVVRESEYARTPENLPVVNRIIGAIGKVQSGGAGLTDEDRKALVIGAKAISNERGAVFNDRRRDYSSLASDLGIDPSVVTRTVQEYKPYDVGGSKTTAPVIPGVDMDAIDAELARRKLGKGK